MAYKQVVVEKGMTPNPKSVQKDNERIENLAIDLKHGISQNRLLGFQVKGETLIEGMNQAADFALIKRLQIRSAKFLKVININYGPYPEYRKVMFDAVNNFMAAMTEIIVSVYRNKNELLFKKPKYQVLIDSLVAKATQDLFKEINPLSEMVRESGYNGL